MVAEFDVLCVDIWFEDYWIPGDTRRCASHGHMGQLGRNPRIGLIAVADYQLEAGSGLIDGVHCAGRPPTSSPTV